MRDLDDRRHDVDGPDERKRRGDVHAPGCARGHRRTARDGARVDVSARLVTGTTPNTRLYAGEELDPDLGLLNLRARQYRPETERFLTIDPVMGSVNKPITLNRYLYAVNDPANLLDPSGRGPFGEYAQLVANVGFTYINTFVLPGMNEMGKECAWLLGTLGGGLIKIWSGSGLVGLIANMLLNLACRI